MGNVKMRHPDRDHDDIVEVNERAFEHVWSKKGWELVNPFLEVDFSDETDSNSEPWGEDESDPDPTDTRIPTLESIEEGELREVAEELGIELGIEGHEELTANELRSLIGNTPEFYDNPADWPDA